jgi:erythronate-4-phosphate dehydrogenase
MEGILRECDVISFHVPLNMEGQDKTYHLANYNFFNRLNKGTILINSSRGEVVDTTALKNAIDAGIISGAVLDVWENEPNIDQELMDLVDIATPHIAGYSADGKANGTMMSVQSVSRFFNLGLDHWKPQNVPVPENTQIEIDGRGKDLPYMLTEIFEAIYPILEDDKRLRANVSGFEQQRATYPLRREFTTYTIHLKNDNNHYGKILEKFGFHTLIE